ncbi:hypothetical protein LguiA_022376 [Lonicera macranthoides]
MQLKYHTIVRNGMLPITFIRERDSVLWCNYESYRVIRVYVRAVDFIIRLQVYREKMLKKKNPNDKS